MFHVIQIDSVVAVFHFIGVAAARELGALRRVGPRTVGAVRNDDGGDVDRNRCAAGCGEYVQRGG